MAISACPYAALLGRVYLPKYEHCVMGLVVIRPELKRMHLRLRMTMRPLLGSLRRRPGWLGVGSLFPGGRLFKTIIRADRLVLHFLDTSAHIQIQHRRRSNH